jgi:arabinofuranosyltransferase
MQSTPAATAESGVIRALPVIVAASIPLLVLAVHAYQYLPFISDDSLISLRYADRLLDGHGLTWTDGERVEGYSNLLWILCVALVGSFGVDLIDAARILGFAGMGAAILAATALYRPHDARSTFAALAAGLAMALTGSFAVWTVGGLEQPLLIALLAWATVWCIRIQQRGAESVRDAVVPGVLLGLACWTLPDSPIFVVLYAGLLAGLGGVTRAKLRTAGAMALIAFAFPVAQLAFRLVYYGDWISNSARAKGAFTTARLAGGVDYLVGGLLPLFGLVVPALLAVGVVSATPARRRRIAWLFVPALAWGVYVVAVGGDSFPGRRHLVVLVFFLALLAAELFARIRPLWLAASALTAALGLLGWAQWEYDPEHLRAKAETREWDGQVVGTLLQWAFAHEQPLVAVTAAGGIPYFSGLPSLDMLGSNDRYLATHPPADFGDGALGHELGDGAYVLAREPDLVIFCSPRGSLRPCLRSGKQLVRIPEFGLRYRPVQFLGSDPYPVRSQIWVRTDSPKTGAIRRRDFQSVPGYLLLPRYAGIAELDYQGRIGRRVTAADPPLTEGFSLESGDWNFRLEATGDFDVGIWRDRTQLARAYGDGSGKFTLAAGDPVGVTFAIDGAGHIRRVIVERP